MVSLGLSDPHDTQLAHYTNYQSLIGIIESGEFWATNILYMNDSSEYIGALKFIRKQVESPNALTEFPKTKELVRAIIAQILTSESIIIPGSPRICIISFSEKCDLLSQWRAYARPSGVSLIFSQRKLEKLAKIQGYILAKCVYTAEEKLTATQHMIENLNLEGTLSSFTIEQISSLSTRHAKQPPALLDCLKSATNKLNITATTFKDEAFMEESEWRIIFDTSSCWNQSSLSFRVNGEIMIPFAKFKFRENASDKNPIHQVIIGPSSSQMLNGNAVSCIFGKHNLSYYQSWSSIPLR